MAANLAIANNLDAWAVKLADITDNLKDVHLMDEPRKVHRFLYF